MRLRGHQIAELIGIVLLLGSTAMQLFYLEPIKREIEWRLAAFSVQQSGQINVRATFDNQIAILKAVNASQDTIAAAQTEREKVTNQFKTADANISDYLIEKESVEGWLEYLVIGLFAAGSLLAGIGRVLEMSARPD